MMILCNHVACILPYYTTFLPPKSHLPFPQSFPTPERHPLSTPLLRFPLTSKTLHTPTPVSHSCLPLLSSPYAPLWSLLLSFSLPLGLCTCQPCCLPCLLLPLWTHSAIPGPQLRYEFSRKTRSVTISQSSASTAAGVTHK